MCTGTDSVYTCGLDDTVRSIDLLSNQYSNLSIKMDSQPRGMATADGNLVVVAGINDISLLENDLKVATHPIDYEASSVTIHPKEQEIAVGGNKDHKVHVYVLKGHNIEEKTTMDHAGAITDVRFSPDGQYLAASDSNRMVRLYISSSYELAHNLDWCFHTARVNCIGWSPDSKFLATGSLDTGVIIWSTEQPTKHINIKKAHPQSQITRLAWLDNSTIVSAGQDSNVKIWEIKFS
uniref:Actin-interacting protein 1 n=2 Tax=Ixodes ricinus TaxID=34613 RepID=A0A0K8R7B6_IXORI